MRLEVCTDDRRLQVCDDELPGVQLQIQHHRLYTSQQEQRDDKLYVDQKLHTGVAV